MRLSNCHMQVQRHECQGCQWEELKESQLNSCPP